MYAQTRLWGLFEVLPHPVRDSRNLAARRREKAHLHPFRAIELHTATAGAQSRLAKISPKASGSDVCSNRGSLGAGDIYVTAAGKEELHPSSGIVYRSGPGPWRSRQFWHRACSLAGEPNSASCSDKVRTCTSKGALAGRNPDKSGTKFTRPWGPTICDGWPIDAETSCCDGDGAEGSRFDGGGGMLLAVVVLSAAARGYSSGARGW